MADWLKRSKQIPSVVRNSQENSVSSAHLFFGKVKIEILFFEDPDCICTIYKPISNVVFEFSLIGVFFFKTLRRRNGAAAAAEQSGQVVAREGLRGGH